MSEVSPASSSVLSPKLKAERFLATLKQAHALGLFIGQVDNNELEMHLPYHIQIVGNPLTGVLHGGALTTLMDTACGTLVFTQMPDFELCPTLDLRVDYMQAAAPKQNLIARAKITHVTASVVFTECNVFQQDDVLIARCGATFMRIGPEMTPPEFRQLITGGTQ